METHDEMLMDYFRKVSRRGRPLKKMDFYRIYQKIRRYHPHACGQSFAGPQLFELLAVKHCGKIEAHELRDGWALLMSGDPQKKAEAVFRSIARKDSERIMRIELEGYVKRNLQHVHTLIPIVLRNWGDPRHATLSKRDKNRLKSWQQVDIRAYVDAAFNHLRPSHPHMITREEWRRVTDAKILARVRDLADPAELVHRLVSSYCQAILQDNEGALHAEN